MLRQITVIALLAAAPALGCINEFGTGTNLQAQLFPLREGTPTPEEFVEKLAGPARNWSALIQERQKHLGPAASFEARNDYAVALDHLGRHKEALAIFEQLERERPGTYTVATNLGTTYELLGRNDEALVWIKEGVRRNPQSHMGTEWLHVKILEAKRAIQRDHRWLETNSVAGASFGSGKALEVGPPPRDFLGRERSLPELQTALQVQLHERLQFVKAPEPIVGDLLFDLGNTVATTLAVEHAVKVYELAEVFGAERKVFRQRKWHMNTLLWKAKAWDLAAGTGLVVLLVGVLATLIWLKVRESRRAALGQAD